MRVTSAPDCASSCAATAASLALSEPDRSDPGITRILSADISLKSHSGPTRLATRRRAFSPKMLLTDNRRVFYSQIRHPLVRNAPYQPLRYTQTRAGGRFIQIRSEASVDTPGSDFGIGGATE